MAHIIEVARSTFAEARSFLDALFYSDSVSAIGCRSDCNGKTRAVAVNWDEDGQSEFDDQISEMIDEAMDGGEEMDEIRAYLKLYPDTVAYQPEVADWQDNKAEGD